MIRVTGTEKKDFHEVLALINHVFGKENSSNKMEDIFTDLLCENNREHMRIVKVDNKPVSVVNYIINEVSIDGCIIKAANIGAVCTHENFRGRGYSRLILKDCIDKMRSEGVDFLYVSGEIELYTKNNIHIAGKMFNFHIQRDNPVIYGRMENSKCEVRSCTPEDIKHLAEIYDAESVRFIRSKTAFTDLIGRVPGAAVFNHASKVFIVEEGGQMQGYFICAVVPRENGNYRMEVIEYAGDRQSILAGMIKLLDQEKPEAIIGNAAWFDTSMVQLLKEYEILIEAANYPGTMRIINFSQLMHKLAPLRIHDKGFEGVEFHEADGKYVIRLGKAEVQISDDKTMHELFLGNAEEVAQKEYINGEERLVEVLKLMLPIPVPYPYNLNFI